MGVLMSPQLTKAMQIMCTTLPPLGHRGTWQKAGSGEDNVIPPMRYASPSENLMSCEKRLADHVSEENMVVSAHPRWSDGGDAGGHRLCTGFNNWHWVIEKWVTKS